MANEVLWFSKLIRTLCSDYSVYNSIIEQMILLSANPLKSQLNSVMVEEQRISRKIIRQERIIQKWLKEASVLAEKAAPELSDLASMRRKSAALRIKGSESLRSGMAVLAKERQNSKGHIRFKSNNKETAPRLIDIKL